MKIYEIDREIESLLSQVDEETGELLIDTDRLEALQMERDGKVENLALAFKNLKAEAEAIKAEEAALAERRKTVEKAAARAKDYLLFVLNGDTFKSPRVAISYRKSTAVKIDDGFLAWAMVEAPDLLRYKDPEPDKKAITDMLKEDKPVPFAELVTNTSVQIK